MKTDAPKLLRKELSAKNWKPQVVGMSGVTDCYQPIERKLKLTRAVLKIFLDFRNPVTIITKNALVARDIDVLSEMAKWECVSVNVSVTSLNQELTMKMEPRTSVPRRRLEAIKKLSDAGVPVNVLVAPIIPGLNDHEVPAILKAVKEAGARTAHFVPLRLPGAVLPVFTKWAEAHFPDRVQRIVHAVQNMRGGKMYDSRFHHRMRGTGEFFEQIKKMFELHARKLQLDGPSAQLTTQHFRVRDPQQMGLFD